MPNLDVRIVEAKTSNSSSQLHIGRGAVKVLNDLLPRDANKALVITQEWIERKLDINLEHDYFFVPDGEVAKSFQYVEKAVREMAQSDFHRNDLVITLGGGVVSDLGGFIAAIYNRGVRVIHLPTTLLGQVDASIGGKTGINLKEGKNLVGAFLQPSAVVIDPNFLETLPRREWNNGYGEVAKYELIGAGHLHDLDLVEQIFNCALFKSKVVEEDEFEHTGKRALLNYGHTLAHALETLGFADEGGGEASSKEILRHGEAVGVGVVFAAQLACKLGRIGEERLGVHKDVVESYGLSTELPDGLSATAVIRVMKRDKKSTGSLAFVLDGENGVELVHDVDESEVYTALRDFGALE